MITEDSFAGQDIGTKPMPEKTTEASESALNDLLCAAKCPKCGDKVFIPNKNLAKQFGDAQLAYNDPQVWCVDHWHWIGYLSECDT